MEIRRFDTGASRDTDKDKIDFEGHISPLVLIKFGEYMHKHRFLPNGDFRDSDDWQQLFGTFEEHKDVCMESGFRHFLDWWTEHRGYSSRDGIDEALCGLMFNIMAYYHPILVERLKNET